MTEPRENKWAIPEPVTSIIEIEQAVTDHELLARAFEDAVEQFARMTIVGHSIPEAIRRLENWRATFERGFQ